MLLLNIMLYVKFKIIMLTFDLNYAACQLNYAAC